MAKEKPQADNTINVLRKQVEDFRELVEYQDKVLGTADKMLKAKDDIIDILEQQKEIYTAENKMLTAVIIGFTAVFVIIGIVKVISLIL
jgi:hypothetical protein